MSKKYARIFSNLPQMKDELVNYLIHTLGWMVHYLFYKFFSKQRFFFDLRFIIDCYHTIIFELNGIYVSDQYIRLNLERLFTNRFLCYESLGKPKRQPVNKRPTKFLGNFDFDQPQITSLESQQFKQILDDKFKAKRKPQVQQQKHDDIYTEILRENLLAKTGVHHSKKPFISTSNIKSQNKISLNKNNNNHTKSQPNITSLNGSQHHIKDTVKQHTTTNSSSNNQKMPYLGNLSLNCTQVSPTVGKVLYYENMQLPYKKKKVIKHIMDNFSDQQGSLIQKVKFYKNKMPKKEQKQDKKAKEQLIDIFNLRVPNKEYYQKHDEHQDKLFKDMLDLYYVFSHYREGLDKLPSSIETLKNYEYYKKQTEAKQHMEQTKQILAKEQQLKQKIEEEKKKQRAFKKNKFNDRMKIGIKNNNNSNKVSPLQTQTNFEDMAQKMLNKDNSGQNNNNNQVSQSQLQQKQQSQKLFHRDSSHNIQLPKIQQNNNSSSGNNNNNEENNQTPPKSSFLGVVEQTQVVHSVASQFQQKKNIRDFQQQSSTNNRSLYTKVLECQDDGAQSSLPVEELENQEEQFQSQKEDFVYIDKRQKYREKYSNLGKYTSTDANIDNLQMDLIQRQNMVKKGMQSRIHAN